MKYMSAVLPAVEISDDAGEPQLLRELPSRREIFFGNLRDLILPPRMAPLELRSAPAAFWPDVFVKHDLPWNRWIESGILHLAAIALLVGITHRLALHPRVSPAPAFDRAQVVYYQASEYLPPLDTRKASPAALQKADPVLSRQTIISVPPEADNRQQTIVTPPKLRLKTEVALPNMVAWSNAGEKPRLAIAPAPMTPAAEINRLAPQRADPVATPPADASQIESHRRPPVLENSIAPPGDLVRPARSLGNLNVAPSPVIAPAPQLAVSPQRSVGDGRRGSAGAAVSVVPPPPTLGAAGNPGTDYGARGRVVALNVHPTLSAPADPPAGNRRGAFAATPSGQAGATGASGSLAGDAHALSGGREAAGKETPGLPPGLYVQSPNAKPEAVAGNGSKSSTNPADPELMASAQPPRVTTRRPAQAENTAKLTDAERAVFGNRRFYSVMLNLPNLNSSGGSWVIRFAELKGAQGAQDAATPPPDLSQPMATRTVDPAYPTQLMRENVSGTVILYAVIHADGSVGNVRVLRSVDERLDRFASDAISQWKFEPATRNGSPVDVEATFKIPFRPSRMGTNF
jgi:TonB family protein